VLKSFSVRRLSREKKDIKTTLLIDCSGLAYSAFNTVGHLSYEGKNTGVIYGFLRNILSLAKKFKTNDFIFCWDSGAGYRHLDYPGYKARRWQKREEYTKEEKKAYQSLLLQIMNLNHEIIPNLGFKNNFIQLMYEADDLLAKWVKKLSSKKNKIIMITNDADMYQCLDNCVIWNPTKKKFITKKILKEEFGVDPNQWAMAKAIGGCSSDGIKGIDGVSDPKKPSSKALKYIQGIMPDGKIKSRIESGQERIKRNLPIVTVPYREDLMKRMVRRRNKFSRRKFIKVFDSYRFKSFLERDYFSRWEEMFLRNK